MKIIEILNLFVPARVSQRLPDGDLGDPAHITALHKKVLSG